MLWNWIAAVFADVQEKSSSDYILVIVLECVMESSTKAESKQGWRHDTVLFYATFQLKGENRDDSNEIHASISSRNALTRLRSPADVLQNDVQRFSSEHTEYFG